MSWQPESPTVYVSPVERAYNSLDVYAFHVEPATGDVYLHYLHTGIAMQVRIHRDDWDGLVFTVGEEHVHMVSPASGTGHTARPDAGHYTVSGPTYTGGNTIRYTDNPDAGTADADAGTAT